MFLTKREIARGGDAAQLARLEEDAVALRAQVAAGKERGLDTEEHWDAVVWANFLEQHGVERARLLATPDAIEPDAPLALTFAGQPTRHMTNRERADLLRSRHRDSILKCAPDQRTGIAGMAEISEHLDREDRLSDLVRHIAFMRDTQRRAAFAADSQQSPFARTARNLNTLLAPLTKGSNPSQTKDKVYQLRIPGAATGGSFYTITRPTDARKTFPRAPEAPVFFVRWMQGGEIVAVLASDGRLHRRTLDNDAWARIVAEFRALEADFVGHMEACCARLGQCWLCHKPIKTDVSVAAGMGPVCSKKSEALRKRLA